jgi:hypothetical protein
MRTAFLTAALISLLVLSACSSASAPVVQAQAAPAAGEPAASPPGESAAAPAAPDAQPAAPPQDAPILAQDYEGALSVRNQLLTGTLLLEDSPLAVTSEQAAKLLPLWQMLNALNASANAAPEELDAVTSLILKEMTPAQLTAIKNMALTGENTRELRGATGESTGEGMGQGQGQGSGLTEAEKAARRATRTASEASGSGTGGINSLLPQLIDLLSTR